MTIYTVKITEIREEAEGTRTFFFEKPEDMNWDEGSHMHVALSGFNSGEKVNKGWVRHMSIATLPDENKVGITTRIPGSGSEFKTKLAQLKAGDELHLFKMGSRLSLVRRDLPVVLISMGVGIAAFRPLMISYCRDKTGIPFLENIHVDSSKNYIYKAELETCTDSSCTHTWACSREEFYNAIKSVTEKGDAVYYVVGSDDFLKDVLDKLKANNVKAYSIVLDKKDEECEALLNW